MAADGMLGFSVMSVVEDVLRQQGTDIELASKKRDEESSRRYDAAEWLRKIVGVVYSKDLPAEPSVQDFRLGLRSGIILCTAINKVKPGSISKVVDPPNHTVIIPDSVDLMASQYFENVRNFLDAAEEMGVPIFEASDLEQGGQITKVVDSVLGLKSFHDWKVAGGIGKWKYSTHTKPPIAGKPITRKNSEPILSSMSRTSSLSEKNFDAFGNEQYSDLDMGDLSNPHSINLIIRSLLKDKKLEEIPNIIQCMLSRVVEEIENRIASPNEAEYWQEKATPEIISSNLSPSDSPKAETQNISPLDSPKAETLNMSPIEHPKEEPQEKVADVSSFSKENISPTDSPAVNAIENVSVPHSPKKQLENNEEGTATDEGSEKQQVHEEVRSQPDILLEAKHCLLNKCKHLFAQQHNSFQELRGNVNTTKETVLLLQKKYQEEFNYLGKHLQTLTHAALGYKKVLEENRKLYNQVQDLKGNIRVYCRVRPFMPGEQNEFTTVEHFEDQSITISTPSKSSKDARKTFTFNKVFGPAATQAEVFVDMQPLVRSVLDGYNVCIFAYGQTGAGKTFTMTGPNDPTEETYGVNYRALNDLFFLAREREATASYEVSVQMMEIYNEQVRDLLAIDSSNKRLEIRNSTQNGINVPDANRLPVSTTADVINLMNLGHKNRAVSSTAMNDRSSRSHSCMTIHVQGKDLTSEAVVRGCMHLVDLAGSERVDKSEVTGDRLKEAQHINKSLAALGDVIASLATKNTHVPYRNSKLTQLLQDSLGGQAKTLMFVHISPEADSVSETISTLKFAERVGTVELGAARANKESSDVKELKDQISSLKAALANKEEEMEQFVCSLTGTPESMSMKSNSAASSSIHPSLTTRPKSAASSRIHPSLNTRSNSSSSLSTLSASRAPKDTSSSSHKSLEKSASDIKNDRSTESKGKTRRKSLDPNDILANEAHWPPLSAVTKRGTSGGLTAKKVLTQRSSSVGNLKNDSRKPRQQKISSAACTSDISGGDTTDDNLDELSVATSDSSDCDHHQLQHKNHLARVSSLSNGVGSKIKKPQARAPTKSSDTSKSMIPTVPTQRVSNEGNQAVKNGNQVKPENAK